MNVFIVEGWSDSDQLRRVFSSILTIVTNGTRMNNRIRDQIDAYVEQGATLFILSDPDEAGDQLAKMLWSEYPQLQRIEVNKEEANYFTGKRIKYGVEYMSFKSIKKLLGSYFLT